MALVTFSSDLVFDGAKGSPYVEDDKTGPLGVYGQSKVLAEVAVREQHRNALIIRTSRLFSALRRDNFIALAIRALADGERFVAASDVFASPTYVPDLVHASLDLLIDRERGLWHLTNSCPISEVNVALVSARLAGVDAGSLIARRGRELRAVARYPAHSALTSRRAVLLPTVENALQRYIARCGVDALRSSRPVLSERRAVERPAGVHTLPSGTEALPLPSREELTAAATLSEGLA
jgi:dTDP-4-dehydrorhamnose reductase